MGSPKTTTFRAQKGAHHAGAQTQGVPRRPGRQIRQHRALAGLHGAGSGRLGPHPGPHHGEGGHRGSGRRAGHGGPARHTPRRAPGSAGTDRLRARTVRLRGGLSGSFPRLRDRGHAAVRKPVWHGGLRGRVPAGERRDEYPGAGPSGATCVYAAESLRENDEIAFNAGSHTEVIKMAWGDFERLVRPRMASFTT